MELDWIAEADGQSAADAVVANQAALREAEVTELMLAAHWADLHGDDRRGPAAGFGRSLPGLERTRRLGGVGTPGVQEFAAAELGVLTGRGPVAAATLIADALDLRHRHPRLWAAVRDARLRVWQARRIAARTRAVDLDPDQAAFVDREVAPYVASLPWSRLEALVEAKIIEADPRGAAERERAEAMRRFVATGQCTEYGVKTLVARAAAGDVIFFVAMCDRIAQILLLEGDTDPVDVRRSKAIGILANPARAVMLLAAHTPDGEPGDAGQTAAGRGAADGRLGGEPEDAQGEPEDGAASWPQLALPPAGPEQDQSPLPLLDGPVDPADPADPAVPRAPRAALPSPVGRPPRGAERTVGLDAQVTGELAAALARVDPKVLLPRAVLHVHVAREDLLPDAHGPTDRPGTGLARVDGVGAVTFEHALGLLGHTRVTVQPVIDLEADCPVDAYEIPQRLRRLLRLRTPFSVFPWSTVPAGRSDLDHTVPYSPAGPPGPEPSAEPTSAEPTHPQTRLANLGPLDRRGHRVKTHALGWVHRQPRPGVHLWRSPHGYWHRVDATGTHLLGRNPSAFDLAGARPDPRSELELALAALVRRSAPTR